MFGLAEFEYRYCNSQGRGLGVGKPNCPLIFLSAGLNTKTEHAYLPGSGIKVWLGGGWMGR